MSLSNGNTPHIPVSNLNSLLSDIYVRYVQIREDDFRLHYRVIEEVFRHLHQKMIQVDPYYKKHSSTIQYTGSHADNVRIVKPDEFDMTIDIGLPVSFELDPIKPKNSDIVISPIQAGFVQLRMNTKFSELPNTVENRVAQNWVDKKRFLLRSKFMDWFKSVVNLALNTFEKDADNQPLFDVDGIEYTIRRSESGPAMTLIIENDDTDFKLDVDLVPALKFPASRWPPGKRYRRGTGESRTGDWMLVAKSVKTGNQHDQIRSWRIARPNQEKAIIYDTGNMRQAWRLVKKLRDSLDLHLIASYYIKNMFLREIAQPRKKSQMKFWEKNNPAVLFELMVGKLLEALMQRKIAYFWSARQNLLARIEDSTLVEYASRLRSFVRVLQNPQEYKKVAEYLLTPEEFQDYNATVYYID